jgi:hypothetical protein
MSGFGFIKVNGAPTHTPNEIDDSYVCLDIVNNKIYVWHTNTWNVYSSDPISVPPPSSFSINPVQIGQNANCNGVTNRIAIGFNAETDQTWGTSLGHNAKAIFDGTYGCVAGEDITAIGGDSKAYGWRTTALGARSHAGGQSSTAIGCGAVALSSHAIALGRGSYAPISSITPNAVVIGDWSNRDIFFANSWGHEFDTPISGISIGSSSSFGELTKNKTIILHGQDSFDSRATPSDFNVDAGNIEIASGRGTGSGDGGEVRFSTSPSDGTKAQNQKNNLVVAGKFDSENNPSESTRFLLFDMVTGTYKRVKIDAANSAGAGKRNLYVDN